MSAAVRPRRRMRQRLMLAFSGFALLVAAVYGLYAVVFVYLVEDEMFAGLLQQEAQSQYRQQASGGEWRRPALPFITLHTDTVTLPDDLAPRLAAEPWRREFRGAQGRHYHLLRLEPAAPATPAWLVAEVSQQLVVRPMRGGIAQLLGWSGLVVVLLALGLGAWLARRMTAPLTDLATLVDEASPIRLPRGFAERLPDDEVGALARTLQGLMARIESFIAREREFTRDASHELRTPLAVIRSACERMAARADLPQESSAQLGHIHQSVLQLERTVSTLLLLAREAHEREPSTDIALLPLLERAIVDHAMQLEGRAIDIELCVPVATRVRGPATALQIVVSNLVGNAFAHAADGRILMTAEDGWLLIRNAGSGIDAEALEPFVKGGASTGHGLGLAIVRRVCERHDMALRIESTAGSTEVAVWIGSSGASTGPAPE